MSREICFYATAGHALSGENDIVPFCRIQSGRFFPAETGRTSASLWPQVRQTNRLQIGQPNVIRPSVAADCGLMAALVIRAADYKIDRRPAKRAQAQYPKPMTRSRLAPRFLEFAFRLPPQPAPSKRNLRTRSTRRRAKVVREGLAIR